MSGVWAAGVANLFASVSIILVNKQLVAACNFQFILTTLFLNFASTSGFLETLVRTGRLQPKHLPDRDRWLIAFMGVLTVLLNNASNEANSVGFYQITKLLIIPTVIAIDRLGGIWRTYSTQIVLSLFFTSLGVALATVTDFEVNVRGTVLSAMSIVATAKYQILQGAKQHEHRVSAMQITHSVSWPQTSIAFFAAFVLDVWHPWVKGHMLLKSDGLLEFDLKNSSAPIWLLACCMIAVVMNISTYGLLGKTSPVTYQVLGQLKTCLIVGFGYLFFDVKAPFFWIAWRFSGVAIAVTGIVAYGYFKNSEQKRND